MSLYQHSRCTDTAILPLRIVHTPTHCVIKVKWFNVVNPNSPFYVGIQEEIKIRNEDMGNWVEFKSDLQF